MLTKAEAKRRVELGAAFMDERFPEWWRHLDLKEFDMESDCDCVLGQITGSFNKAEQMFWPAPKSHWWQPSPVIIDHAAEHGFDAPRSPFRREREHDYKTLQDAWAEQMAIRAARESAEAVDAIDPVGEKVTD